MAWGRSRARHPAAAVGGDGRRKRGSATVGGAGPRTQDSPVPVAQCAKCERSVMMPGGELPGGWIEIDGEALCPDDAPSPAALRARNGAALELRQFRRGDIAIGPEGAAYIGCRILHEFAPGGSLVGLRIHAGREPRRSGRDDPATFMLGRDDLGVLIAHLQRIRKAFPNG